MLQKISKRSIRFSLLFGTGTQPRVSDNVMPSTYCICSPYTFVMTDGLGCIIKYKQKYLLVRVTVWSHRMTIVLLLLEYFEFLPALPRAVQCIQSSTGQQFCLVQLFICLHFFIVQETSVKRQKSVTNRYQILRSMTICLHAQHLSWCVSTSLIPLVHVFNFFSRRGKK